MPHIIILFFSCFFLCRYIYRTSIPEDSILIYCIVSIDWTKCSELVCTLSFVKSFFVMCFRQSTQPPLFSFLWALHALYHGFLFYPWNDNICLGKECIVTCFWNERIVIGFCLYGLYLQTRERIYWRRWAKHRYIKNSLLLSCLLFNFEFLDNKSVYQFNLSIIEYNDWNDKNERLVISYFLFICGIFVKKLPSFVLNK